MYLALGYVQKTGLLSVAMPNAANMAFNYYYVLWAIMATYVPGEQGGVEGDSNGYGYIPSKSQWLSAVGGLYYF